MTLFIKFDFNRVCKVILEEILAVQGLDYKILGFSEVQLSENVSTDQLESFRTSLTKYGIDIVENQKSITVQKIKDTIIDMVYNDELDINIKSSAYIAHKVGQSYGYLSNLFSEVTYTSIENFIILQKIEYTKHLIINQGLTLTEIAFKLDYSSVAHLSTQFKNTTGITPSAFQKIIAKRRELNINNLNQK